FNLNGLVAGLGIGGVIVTLAAQDTAKNLFGGLVIFLDKPFVVGDWIEMPPFEGTVEDITFRSTRIRTFENSLVNIPNSIISNSSIINWSKMEKRRYKTNLCIQIDTPLEKLERFKLKIQEMLQEKEGILDDSIIVKFDTIADNGINILICSYTDSVDYTSYITERENINYKIMKILREENIELVYDTKTVYVKNS
ncbi:MAG: mechanosensitive ion channel family protein, partial [Clostridia bacterium]|nr:mechanosensitive ion channel family protein [Clostridia bacterium]